MTESEYNERLKKIEADYRAALKSLYIEYALSQAQYKVDDIIRGSGDIIKITKITGFKSNFFPEPVYEGIVLKKNLEPRKDGSMSSIFGNSMTTLIKKG